LAANFLSHLDGCSPVHLNMGSYSY